MKIDKLKPGMTVYDVHSYTMGNTTARSIGVWHLKIIKVEPDTGIVTASWNNNKPRQFIETEWSKWRLKEPQLIKSGWGYRLAKRGENP